MRRKRRQLGSLPDVHAREARAADTMARKYVIQTNQHLRAKNCRSAVRTLMEANAHVGAVGDERAHAGLPHEAPAVGKLVDAALTRFVKVCLRKD